MVQQDTTTPVPAGQIIITDHIQCTPATVYVHCTTTLTHVATTSTLVILGYTDHCKSIRFPTIKYGWNHLQ